MWLSLKHSYIK